MLKILHWNILAGISADNTPRGFPYVQSQHLDWEYRKPQVIKMIKDEDPDLISLVEVDQQQRADLISEFEPDYEIVHHFKTTGRWEDKSKEGSMLGVRKGIAAAVIFKCFYFTNYSQICNYVQLTINDTPVVFASLHLKAKTDFTIDRIKQVRQVKQFLAGLYDYHQDDIGKNTKYIIAGDFNDDPDSMPVKMLLDNYQMLSDRSQITTFKRRQEYKKATIDYIFGSYNLTLIKSDVPKEHLVHDPKYHETALPNADFPSDHLYLIVDILI